MMPSIEQFREEARAQIARAKRQGRLHVEINAGELHRTLGGYPGPSHSMPSCCQAMRDEYEIARDVVVYETNSGNGAAFTIRYQFPG
jgi:5-methylcytosine-specific restriction protein A